MSMIYVSDSFSPSFEDPKFKESDLPDEPFGDSEDLEDEDEDWDPEDYFDPDPDPADVRDAECRYECGFWG